MNQLKRNMMGPKLDVNQQKISLKGHIYRFSDLLKFYEVGEFYLQAHRDQEVQRRLYLYLQKNLIERGISAHFVSKPNSHEVLFSKSLEPQKKVIHAVLNPLGLWPKFSNSEISMSPMVRVQIVVAEVSKNFRQSMGLHWQHELQHELLPVSALTKNLSWSLRALEQKGDGQILASPNLMAKSGQEAQFLAGGEFPIKVVLMKKQHVTWKRYGILLNIKPIVNPTGFVDLKLTTEVSTIDSSQTVDGIPGLKTNRISSHFNLKPQQTLLLSGLIKENQGEDLEGLPYLQNLPILGPLFRSKNFMKKKTELLIFVKPTLVSTETSK